MSTEVLFNSAVKVIRSLPKSGSFQPSDDMKLKFYAFFKQASEGQNQTKKPGLLDPVGKYKWEAWNKLGDMSKGEAMKGYIDAFIENCKNWVLTDADKEFFELLAPFKQHFPEKSQQILSKHNF